MYDYRNCRDSVTDFDRKSRKGKDGSDEKFDLKKIQVSVLFTFRPSVSIVE
jgi:hypothetical protein